MDALLSLSVTPKTDGDRERLARAVRTLMAEHPAPSVTLDHETGAAVVAAMNEGDLESIVDRLRREFEVEATVGHPQVAYKETFRREAEGSGRYVSESAGRGQYAHVRLRISPGRQGSGCVFQNHVVDGAIPAKFITPIEHAVRDALGCGVVAGYPVDDVCVVLYDGSYHEVDSSKESFRIASALAFKDAANSARPVVLEPVMRIEVTTPQDCAHDVFADLLSRRAKMHSREERDGIHRIQAHAPLSEMFGYASDLRSRTRGSGAFTMQFARYEPLDGAANERGDDPVAISPRRPSPKLRDSSAAEPEPGEATRD